MAESKEKAVETSKMNLYQKILAVSALVRNVEKNLNVPTGKNSYKAVSDYDVTLKAKEAEAKFGVLAIPYRQEIINSEVLTSTDNYGNQRLTYVVDIKMTTRLIDCDRPEDYIEIDSYGKGIDTGDKGYGKASTYARKYALLNAYKIATGDDPDVEASPEAGTQGKPTEKGSKKGENKPISDPLTPTPTETPSPLQIAVNEVNSAKNLEDLKVIVDKYREAFGKTKDFTNAVNGIFKKFSNGN